MSTLRCDHLSAWFGTRKVLDDITLSVGGGITALIGPSGCGKSTLIKCFNRINDLEPDFRIEGEILLDGRRIGTLPEQLLRRKVGMVFQRPTPFSMTIFNNVAFGVRAGGMRDKRKLEMTVEKALRDASLWDEVKDRLDTPARGLSGGQQQRLCIARALAVSPEILLLDEPTSALDPISTDRIEQTLLSLKEKLTMVLVSHNMRQVRSICEQTAFFEQGRLIELQNTDALFAYPRFEQTKRYLQP